MNVSILDDKARKIFNMTIGSGAHENELLARKMFFEYLERKNIRAVDVDIVPIDQASPTETNRSAGSTAASYSKSYDTESNSSRMAQDEIDALIKQHQARRAAELATFEAANQKLQEQAQELEERNHRLREQDQKIEEQARENAALKDQLESLHQNALTGEADRTVSECHDQIDHPVQISIDTECVNNICLISPMAVQDFSEQVSAVAGRQHWKSAFAHHARMPMQRLKADLRDGPVSLRLVGTLRTLQPSDLLPASRQHWTTKERARLSILLEEGLSDVDLAHRLSSEFRRRIFEGGVARQRRRLQRVSSKDNIAVSQHARRTIQRGRNLDITAAGPCIA